MFFYDDHHLDIIDSGFCTHANQTVLLLKSFLHQFQHLSTRNLFNTHLHSDHCGGNHALEQQFSLTCFVPEAEFLPVSQWDVEALGFEELGQPCPNFTAHQSLVPGESINIGAYQFEIHATPGHHPKSILLFEPHFSLLISADVLWENGFGAIFSGITDPSGFLEQRESLKLIEHLHPKIILPGHGQPFTDVQTALKSAFSRLDYLEANPDRNAHHVAQVLFKFMLMFEHQITFELAQRWFQKTPIIQKAASHLSLSTEELMTHTMRFLQQAGVMKVQDNVMMNEFNTP
jgi:glyoxylase-like metal-dependent hydrolase (beta-lactamase superfamily II)